jgi:hypothetical protein
MNLTLSLPALVLAHASMYPDRSRAAKKAKGRALFTQLPNTFLLQAAYYTTTYCGQVLLLAS